jgi:hypothetical protein
MIMKVTGSSRTNGLPQGSDLDWGQAILEFTLGKEEATP